MIGRRQARLALPAEANISSRDSAVKKKGASTCSEGRLLCTAIRRWLEHSTPSHLRHREAASLTWHSSGAPSRTSPSAVHAWDCSASHAANAASPSAKTPATASTNHEDASTPWLPAAGEQRRRRRTGKAVRSPTEEWLDACAAALSRTERAAKLSPGSWPPSAWTHAAWCSADRGRTRTRKRTSRADRATSRAESPMFERRRRWPRLGQSWTLHLQVCTGIESFESAWKPNRAFRMAIRLPTQPPSLLYGIRPIYREWDDVL